MRFDTLVVVGSVAPAASLRRLFAACFRLRIGAQEDELTGSYGMAETIGRQPVALLVLEALDANGGVCAEFSVGVQTHRVSAWRTRNNLLANLGTFLELAPRKLAPHVTAAGTARASVGSGMKPIDAVGGLALAVASRVATRAQWVLAVAKPLAGSLSLPDWRTASVIAPPADRLWAVPFLVSRGGRTWMFFEEAPFRSNKGGAVGRIAVAEVDIHGFKTPVRIALDRPYHLSYPFVFEHEGEWFLLPESAAASRLDLFRCTRWPDQWEHHRTLLEGVQVYDSTLARIGDRYWLFAAWSAAGAVTADYLDLFFGDSPFGPFTRHPASPVAADARWGRPGGRLFERDGVGYRPAQDSSRGVYGRAIRIQRIDRLTADDYAETTVHVIEPGWRRGIRATHTLDATADLVSVDGCRACPRVSFGRRWARTTTEQDDGT
jgi:hypothetical protein